MGSRLLLLLPLCLDLTARGVAGTQDPLQVFIYFESLCPACGDFLSGSFARGWSAVPEILDVTLVPWGFTQASRLPDGGWNFSCQHGPEECRLDRLHGCAAQLAGQQARSVDFSVCLETAAVSEQQCAADSGLDYPALTRCVQDPETDQLMLHYRNLTLSLQPPVSIVPTATVDGNRSFSIITDFLQYVCAAWHGPTPPGCGA